MKKITSMVVENFLSFGNAEFCFDEQGLVLVEGDNRDDESASSNGSGKSAMIDALVWCLFGTTLRGYDGDEVVHRKAKVGDGCVVHVRFCDGDDGWVVTRARRHPTIKNALVLMTQDGDDRSKPSARETQEEIERVLGCTRRTFLSSVVFGQDRAYRFSALTDGEQKQVLDEVLGVERFAQACVVARAHATAASAIASSVRRDLDRVDEAIADADRQLDELRQKNADFAAERDRKLAVERDKLAKADEWLGKARRSRDVDELREVVADITRSIQAHDDKVDRQTETSVAAATSLAKVKAEREAVEADLLARQMVRGRCPTCGQAIDRQVEAMENSGLHARLGKLKARSTAAAAASADALNALSESKLSLKEARDELAVVQKTLNESVGAAADAEAWRRRAVDCQARISEIEGEENPYTALAAKAEARLGKHAKEAELLGELLAAEGVKLRFAQFWVEAFGTKGLRSLLVDSSLPLLNQEAARVSRAITGGTISVEFSATSELKSGKSVDRFEVRVDNRHGAGSYRGNSAGERAKVDLCVGLALQRLVASRSSSSFNVVFFDEAFDHLDSAAHERVVEVLAELDRDSVFVVSHNEDLRAFFPNVLTIKKQGGFSSVE